jgi:hypothetical protein
MTEGVFYNVLPSSANFVGMVVALSFNAKRYEYEINRKQIFTT